MYEIPLKNCSVEGCEAGYKPHHWGTKKAQRDGWFLQKDGTAWCSEHNPSRVEEWRAKQSARAVKS